MCSNGNGEHQAYALYLDLENLKHTRSKTTSPHTNRISERLHPAIHNECDARAFRRKRNIHIEQRLTDVPEWLHVAITAHTHSGAHY